jgi:hypothetical protein
MLYNWVTGKIIVSNNMIIYIYVYIYIYIYYYPPNALEATIPPWASGA